MVCPCDIKSRWRHSLFTRKRKTGIILAVRDRIAAAEETSRMKLLQCPHVICHLAHACELISEVRTNQPLHSFTPRRPRHHSMQQVWPWLFYRPFAPSLPVAVTRSVGRRLSESPSSVATGASLKRLSAVTSLRSRRPSSGRSVGDYISARSTAARGRKNG